MFLPPYSPGDNPIELTFSILKAWIRRHFQRVRPTFESFGAFLRFAIEQSGCDNYGEKHFRKRAGGYIKEAEIPRNTLNCDLLLCTVAAIATTDS